MALNVIGQGTNKKVITSDIDNFWIAYDSIKSTQDTVKQKYFIQTLYIGKGTEGLKAFMKARDYSADLWVKLINQSPKFWSSVRPNTLAAKTKAKDIDKSIKKLKKLYPDLKEAQMYFTVGGLRSGGTIQDNKVLIGTEIATGTATTDVSDLSTETSKWLAGVFKEQSLGTIIPLNIHEYIHTQQTGKATDLLAKAVAEGSCDFITELVMGKPLQNNYLQYGKAHEQELKGKFKEEMFTNATGNWLYNGASSTTVGDLGYFMGYTISKSYYHHATNKKQAIKDIIQLNYSDEVAVENFLRKSHYYPEPINKAELVNQFQAKKPYVVKIEPLSNGDALVDAAVKEIVVTFSAPMSKGYSISLGPKGKEHFPISSITGYSEDRKTLTLKVDLKPAFDYEFILTDRGFTSTDGYPLKPYEVKFKTK
ncbi:hypothetical protein DC20_21710 (plasmid) [Rufibacter tibetensis]|uniref:SbsA Ig-like domain-containing protein n=1 Tax=Rufibacter tibetensis TaxID=512763 RepID=A0A0P0CPW2_9BACT|nr:hypothetical protein DC20_21710 [Rufibacter tibetensis]